MTLLAQLAAALAIVSTGIVNGTDAFFAIVQRSALARVNDATLTAIIGNVHRFADKRMPAPGTDVSAVRARRSAGTPPVASPLS